MGRGAVSSRGQTRRCVHVGSLLWPPHRCRYDAVTTEGKLQWQNTVNSLNRCASTVLCTALPAYA